jgi:polysaccharide deacetylase family protein (PEP-CTERM system associated)
MRGNGDARHSGSNGLHGNVVGSDYRLEIATAPVTYSVKHFFTVDVEEYFQVNAFDDLIPRETWPSLPSRVADNVERVLDLLAQYRVRGTFFTLGWVAKRHSRVVRRIAEAGHEVASHGWWHRKVTTLTASEFREDVRTAKDVLEDITGAAVLGFRAPSFSIVPGREWALDVLIEEGYVYDSSMFPVRRPDYGYPDCPPLAHVIERPVGRLYEFPLATTVFNRVRIPAAGGGYLRHFPYRIIQRAFREHTESGIPGVFYIHPWELDPEQPRLSLPLMTRVRHYRGLRTTAERVTRLLSEFAFTALCEGLPTASPTLVREPRPVALDV